MTRSKSIKASGALSNQSLTQSGGSKDAAALPSSSEQTRASSAPNGTDDAVRFAKDKVLLQRLTLASGKATQEPQRHVSKDRPHDLNRRLTFDQEMALVTTLAFLAGISSDRNHITAVCLEEIENGEACKVLVAINKQNENDNNGVLRKIHSGFRKIFEQMSMLPSK